MGGTREPVASRYNAAERRVLDAHRAPRAVQRWIRALPYNWERSGPTMRSFRGVVRYRTAHCLEAALTAAAILEWHGYPPLLLDLESRDRLDHVVFAFKAGGRWGAVGGSRDVGLFGRRPAFHSVRALAMSYYEPYVDFHARITGYALVDLRDLPRADWRTSDRNVWALERFLIEQPHRRLPTSNARYRRLREQYREFIETNPPTGTPHTRGRHTWM